MTDALKDFYEAVSIIDLIYLVLTTLSLIKCYRKGFIKCACSFKMAFSLYCNFNIISKDQAIF